MARIDSRFVDEAYEPPSDQIVAKQAAEGVGADTASTLTRRDDLNAKAAALRTSAAATLPVELFDLLDAMIAGIFDA